MWIIFPINVLIFTCEQFPVNDELFLAVYERSRQEVTVKKSLWAYRTRISFQDVAHSLGKESQAKEKYPLLFELTQNVKVDFYEC